MIELEFLETIISDEIPVDLWAITLDGEQIGTIQTGLVSPEMLGIEDIFIKREFRGRRFGPRGVRQVLQKLREEYPGIEEIAGIRISGARAKGSPVGEATGVSELPLGTAPLVRMRI